MEKAFFALGSMLRSGGVLLNQLGYRLQGNYAFAETANRHRRILALKDKVPRIMDGSFVAPNASVIGSVTIGKDSAVWYGAVLRGDVNTIRVGNGSSIGDNVVVHCSSHDSLTGAYTTSIGNNVIVGDNSILHGCTVQNDAVIGHGSIVMDGTTIMTGGILEPGSILTPGRTVPPGQVWGGRPAREVRNLSHNEKEKNTKRLEVLRMAMDAHLKEHNLTPQQRRERTDKHLTYEPEFEKTPNF